MKTQRLKQQSEQSRLDAPLHSALKLEIDRIIAKCDLLWANWRMDGVPLQDHSLARKTDTFIVFLLIHIILYHVSKACYFAACFTSL